MSAKKADMSAHEPGWAEVILGAVLSVAIGIALAVVVLAIKPLLPVKEMPKEPVPGMIYYIQGSHDTGKSKQAPAKRKMFAGGGSVAVTEDEINSFLPTPPPLWTPKKAAEKPKTTDKQKEKAPEKAKAPEKVGAPGAPASTGEMIALGGPNFRIHDGAVQIAVPVTFNVLGLTQDVTVLATGNFVKKDAGFVFEPDTLYLGSCPMQRIPFAAGYVVKKFLAAQPVPDDIAAAWPKVSEVAVDGSNLKLTMP